MLGIPTHGSLFPNLKQLVCGGAPTQVNKEFCSILNEAIRTNSAQAQHSAVVARAINLLCVVRQKADRFLKFPRDGLCWRGGDLPLQHRDFYTVGQRHIHTSHRSMYVQQVLGQWLSRLLP